MARAPTIRLFSPLFTAVQFPPPSVDLKIPPSVPA